MSWTDIYHLCNALRDEKPDMHVDGSIVVDALDLVARNNCRRDLLIQERVPVLAVLHDVSVILQRRLMAIGYTHNSMGTRTTHFVTGSNKRRSTPMCSCTIRRCCN